MVCLVTNMMLQSVAKYLRLTLVFIKNRAPQEKFNCFFFTFLVVLAKVLFWQGAWTLGYNSIKIRHFPNIS